MFGMWGERVHTFVLASGFLDGTVVYSNDFDEENSLPREEEQMP